MSRHNSTTMTEWLRDLRRSSDMLRGAMSNRPENGYYRLIAGGHSVAIEDGELTGNDHRWRWLVVDGDHIGRRESWGALERLARKMADTDPSAWSAIKSAEMDREDRLVSRRAY